MQRISSNATLFLKVFFPVFWLVFFGIFTLAVTLSNVEQFSAFNFAYVKVAIGAIFVVFAIVFYFTLIQLKRVELDGDCIYASNYFKTYRYPYHNIEKMTERDMWLFHLVKVYLKTPGNFGKKITFILDGAMLNDFLNKNPEVAERFGELRMEEKV